jgi:hypothetical protein
METEARPNINIYFVLAGVAFCLLLGWADLQWPNFLSPPRTKADLSFPGLTSQEQQIVQYAFVDLLKLIVAALVGTLVAFVHRNYQGDRPQSRSMMQASILLCVSGALMMIIIGDSVSRALGIAGGAGIVRFRTPVEDPRDTIVLFLMLGLGMSVGLGGFAICGLATLFMCLFLAILDRFGEERPRLMFLDLVATSKDFPIQHVNDVLRRTVRSFEAMKMVQGNEAAMRYQVKMDTATPLSYLTTELMRDGDAGLKSVAWEQPKKSEQG